MSTTAPAPLTPAELDALRLALQREAIEAQKAQTDAIKANTAEQIATREAALRMADAMAARPSGISEALFTSTLQLVVTALAGKKPAA
jgi:hypothetical protein